MTTDGFVSADDLDRQWGVKDDYPLPSNDPVIGNSGSGEPLPVTDPPMRVMGNGENGELRDLYVDIGGLLDGTLPEPPAPTILQRNDGNCLFYQGQVNLLFGDPESGKTLIALAAGADNLSGGIAGKVAVIDMDHNGPNSTASRLLLLGARSDLLRSREHFRFVEPDDVQHLYEVVADLSEWKPDVILVDSLGELLPLFGSSNSADDFTVVHTRVLKPLAKSGAAVILIDHLAKGADSRAAGPGGTAAKRRAIGGVSLRVKVNVAFTPGQGGSAYLEINKDRHGGLRQHCPTGDREPTAGLFRMTQISEDILRWEVRAPSAGERAPDDSVSEVDVAAIDKLDPPPRTVADARERLGWQMARTSSALKVWRERQKQPATAADAALPVTHIGGRVTGNEDPELMEAS